ncbi:ATP-binding protein [Roseisolibacter sp. H3M3-2]|uniref:sensor histidine kinase n=1 Tax=Roseisolibacter sp. H3M3-2 TaxID=3031323 RepID=UPI0023DBD678|nr:ATP-binding protein [Roseisolibacter sp. H3M3-2]MDF1504057.1 ATP-binding protein [Roseisolibacter sp. H3M3-2]
MQDTLKTVIEPLAYAPTAFALTLVGAGAVVGAGLVIAARWGVRHARHARALAAAGGHLVVLRTADGVCEPLAVPPRFVPLFTAIPVEGAPLPPWRPELAAALEQLAAQARDTDAEAVAVSCDAAGFALRLVGLRGGDGTSLIVRVAEAGPDAARVNRLETAALLSGGLAHDLRNVLNTLVLHAEVGGDHVHQPVKVAGHFERMKLGATRAADLVALLRRHLRDESPSTVAQPVVLADTVREVVDLLRPGFPRGLAVSHDELAADAVVMAHEPVQLHQLVLNLVLNAQQAMAGRPDARVDVAVTLDDADGAEPTAVLVVEDNGPGMPPEVRARCFEPHFSTKRASGGTGLGLAVVRTIVVDVLGGQIRASAAASGGARFEARLPALGRADARAVLRGRAGAVVDEDGVFTLARS